jgi:hypothetical protein
MYYMTYHNDNALDATLQGFISTFFPVVCTLRLFSQHHGRAMGEEVNGCEAYILLGSIKASPMKNADIPIVNKYIVDLTTENNRG